MMHGLVMKSVGGLFEVRPDDAGDTRLTLRARGSLRRGDGRVLAGDRVTVADEHGTPVIGEVLSRKNALIRPPLANLDHVFVAVAVSDPAPIPETTDKLLAILEHNGIGATVVVTKADLDASSEAIAAVYRTAGYDVFCVSTRTGDGLDVLRAHVLTCLAGGKIGAFAGASGVGKSSLGNALFPALGLETGEISRRIARGKQTTRTTELFPVGDGYLADTPGFSMLDFRRFDFMTYEDLPFAFREFAACVGKCRYTDCRHIKEEECAVRAAVRDGKIAVTRYESYVALCEILRGKTAYAEKN